MINTIGNALEMLFKVLICVAFAFTAILGIGSLFIHMKMDFVSMREAMTVYRTNPLFKFIAAQALFILNALIVNLVYFHGNNSVKKRFWCSVIAGIVLETIFCAVWIASNHCDPVYDQKSIWKMGTLIANEKGNLGDLSYFRLYPHQKSLTLVMSVFARVFQSNGLIIYQAFCLTCANLCLYWGTMIALRLSGQEKAATMTLLLLVEFLPILLYAKYVYGTLPSLSFTLGAFYYIVCWVQEHRLPYLMTGLVLTALMYVFYTGTLIALIAIAVILVLDAIWRLRKERKIRLFSFVGAAIMLAMALVIHVSAGKVFANDTGLTDKKGLPASAWILMGITSQSDYGAGGYDGSSVQLYKSCGENADVTDAAAKEAIREATREYFDGVRSPYFFINKTITQWNDPWFNSLTMTINSVDKVEDLALVFTPEVLKQIQKALVALMNLGYLMSALYMILLIKQRKTRLESLLLPLYFTGGFVFQLFWETKGRYCFPYYVCLLILAGMATASLEQFLESRYEAMRGRKKLERRPPRSRQNRQNRLV